ncbi:MAG TPA: ankyrin repeat domain-containing protein [Gaiellaceae bacterium]|nr:ankyrin repeat domain-containing protein [Gaiellaceae bacterium]
MDLERYRKDAKALVRGHRAGDAEARDRAQTVLGERAERRFGLSDAQHVVAIEHGYRTWPELKRAAERAQRERPVARIGLQPVDFYEQRVDELRRTPDERRLALVPTRDPYVVVAREYGFETWRDLVRTVERVRAVHEGQREGSPEVLAALEAIETGDLDGLRERLDANPALAGPVHTGAWTTLLEALAQPDVVPWNRDAASLLIERSSSLDGPLGLAACFDKAELVEMLLDAGAEPAPDPADGLTPLESALYHGSRAAAEALAARGISPLALWSAAALGRLDLMARLVDEPGEHRPNLADVGWQPGPPAPDDRQTILDEALCLAALNGRTDACEWLLERGATVDDAPYLGMTPLHFAAFFGRPQTVKLLLDRGADPTLRDEIHDRTAVEWAHDPIIRGLVAGVDTGLEYTPGEAVRLRVDVARFPYVSDEGRAVGLAGTPDGWRAAAERIAEERSVNISRGGIVSLPVVAAGPGYEAIVDRIARASVELYEELLELA